MAQYSEFKNKGIWQHFLCEKNGQSAKSKLCKTVLKSVGGFTKGLHKHLKRVHDMSKSCWRHCRHWGELLVWCIQL